jgi:hypothetical protein
MGDDKPNHDLVLYARLVAASRYGGSQLKKYPTAPYSPDIARLRNIQRLLKLAISQFRGSYDLSEPIRQMQITLGDDTYNIPGMLQGCQLALVRATADLQAVIQEEEKSRQLRANHNQTLIQKHKAKGNTKEEKRVRGIQCAEEVKRVIQRCAAARHKDPAGGISHILVPENSNDPPASCSQWKRIVDPKQKQIKEYLLERNRAHFGQAKGCNLTTPPLDFTMQFTGVDARAAILYGTYI